MPSTESDYIDSASDMPKCCCCHTWHDGFERTSINVLETAWGDVPVKRYSFGEVTIPVGGFGYPGLINFDSYTPNGWTIAGGKLSCSTAGHGIKVGAINTYGQEGMSYCFDMTFNGSGKVYYGFGVVFEFDTNRFRLRTNNSNDDGYWFPYTWSSGTTYRIRINSRQYGGIELWVDDVQVWNISAAIGAYQGNWFFTGSGTLTLDNLDIYTLGTVNNPFEEYYEPFKGYPECWVASPCWFPWLDDGQGNPPQIQIEYTTNVTQCRPCAGASIYTYHTVGSGRTVVLDLVTCQNHDFVGYDSGCACYQAQGTFGCFNLITVKFSTAGNVLVDFCEYLDGGPAGQAFNCSGGSSFYRYGADKFYGTKAPGIGEPDDVKVIWTHNTDTVSGSYASNGGPFTNTTCGVTSFTVTVP